MLPIDFSKKFVMQNTRFTHQVTLGAGYRNLTMTIPQVVLPATYDDFFEELLKDGTFLACQGAGLTHQLDSRLKLILKYCGSALKVGRPLNKCLIVMFGESGTGKSSTINKLFEDEICPTSVLTSETRAVVEYSKNLRIFNKDCPNIEASIGFLDIPGTQDVDRAQEPINFTMIKRYRERNKDLASRLPLLIHPVFQGLVRERVYPNLVLLTIYAFEKRLIGPDSRFQCTLKALEHLDLVDKENLNLIIVVTNSMYFDKEEYVDETKRVEKVIQQAVFNVLRIKSVKVVFIENMAQRKGLKKEDGSDFYRLPDGQLSHLNIMKEMANVFQQNGDHLGSLLSGWYFHSECPDKNNPVVVIVKEAQSPNPNPQDFCDITTKLSQLGLIRPEFHSTEKQVPIFYLSSLGHGYCPVTEVVKHLSLLDNQEFQEIQIQGKNYHVPNCIIQTNNNNGSSFHRRSFATKDSYEKHRSHEYGFESGIDFVVKASPHGRWVNDGTQQNTEASLSMALDNRVTSLIISNPKESLSNFAQTALSDLPSQFEEGGGNAYVFNDFFSRYGTHLIVEQPLGGEISYDFKVKTTDFNEGFGLEIKAKIEGIFKQIINGSLNTENSGIGMESIGICDESFDIRGGVPPKQPIMQMQDLTPELYSNWAKSILDYPVELKHGFKLFPFYELLEPGQKSKVLKEATMAYLKNKLPQKEILKRDEFARKILRDVQDEQLSWGIMGIVVIVGAIVANAIWKP